MSSTHQKKPLSLKINTSVNDHNKHDKDKHLEVKILQNMYKNIIKTSKNKERCQK